MGRGKIKRGVEWRDGKKLARRTRTPEASTLENKECFLDEASSSSSVNAKNCDQLFFGGWRPVPVVAAS
ncbi:hypothetical protein Cni_G04926 [Canna indica]|uniref:Uncharacterized protein n=1 Tax=Canna indica TaxID=4628 RepID=A0AAQ3Q4Y1_9LILI|nr:hypothetical protein Cni_G04926 [Canna indica]